MRSFRAASRTAKTRMRAKHFSDDALAALRKSSSLRIRAGNGQHRFIGIWVVVVRDRVFVRSWSVKPNGWYRTLMKDPTGTIKVAAREIKVRAIRTKSEGLKDAVDRAYLDKYNTPGALRYARDLGSVKSRATTIELAPFSLAH